MFFQGNVSFSTHTYCAQRVCGVFKCKYMHVSKQSRKIYTNAFCAGEIGQGYMLRGQIVTITGIIKTFLR